jgi:hypothetical protein
MCFRTRALRALLRCVLLLDYGALKCCSCLCTRSSSLYVSQATYFAYPPRSVCRRSLLLQLHGA